MRVLQIVEATEGGVARHVFDLCAGLRQRDVEVDLIYSPIRMDGVFREKLTRLSNMEVKLLSIPMKRAPHYTDVGVLINIRRYIKDHGGFDILHGHSSKGGGIARLLRFINDNSMCVYSPHTFVTLATWLNVAQRIFYSIIETYLGKITDALIAVSNVDRDEALRLGIPDKKIWLIPNGIALGEFVDENRSSIRGNWGIYNDDVVVGFMGRLDLSKNPLMLLKVFSRLSEKYSKVKLLMVGDGALSEACVKFVKDEQIRNVIFTGYQKGRDLLAAMDIFAVSSDYEGFPYVLLEAMDAGLPIVATDVGGVRMAVEHGKNGFAVPPRNPELFAAYLEILIKDEGLRRRFGQLNKERVKEFSVDRMIEATLSVYRHLLSN